MLIAVMANSFWPAIGGYESVSRIITAELARLGHDVTVITFTSCPNEGDFPFRVVRNPSFMEMRRLISRADVFVQNNVSLRGLIPWLFARTPLVIVHHGWYSLHPSGVMNWRGRLKDQVTRLARNISVSQAVARRLRAPSLVISNPYDDSVFIEDPASRRSRDVIFVGRLVSDKGCDVLIAALEILARKGIRLSLTVVGTGPEEDNLRDIVRKLGLHEQVFFSPPLEPKRVAECLREHRVLVVPSRWQEPFGVVALEGIACGCFVIASRVGGLPEAVGPCGIMVECDDPSELAGAIEAGLSAASRGDKQFRASAARHLEAHRPRAVALQYEVFLSDTLMARNKK